MGRRITNHIFTAYEDRLIVWFWLLCFDELTSVDLPPVCKSNAYPKYRNFSTPLDVSSVVSLGESGWNQCFYYFPALIAILMLLPPFIDRDKDRKPFEGKQRFAIGVIILILIIIVVQNI